MIFQKVVPIYYIIMGKSLEHEYLRFIFIIKINNLLYTYTMK